MRYFALIQDARQSFVELVNLSHENFHVTNQQGRGFGRDGPMDRWDGGLQLYQATCSLFYRTRLAVFGESRLAGVDAGSLQAVQPHAACANRLT